MFKRILIVLMFIVLALNVSAATIHGTIYDNSLNKLENVKLEIDSNPKQTFVSKDGSYSFDVPEGNYVLSSKYYEDGFLKLENSEDIYVLEDGDFVVDLILFEPLDDELMNLSNIDIEDSGLEPQSNNYIWLIILLLVLIIGLLLLKLYKKKPVKDIEDNDLEKIISIIKENGGRIKQRDLRKKFPLSEAKVSLMITELEHEEKIKKIKKGRGNILVLKK